MDDSEISDSDCPACKIALIGESGVGKSSIILRFSKNEFNEDTLATTGGSFTTETIELKKDQRLKILLWDTMGEEKYRSLAKIFYQKSSAVILVYDVTNIKSFKNLKDFWYKEVKQNTSSDIIFAVAGNKNDLDLPLKDKVVDPKEVKEFADSIKAPFFEISAKDSIGIDSLFKTIGEKYLSSNPDPKDPKPGPVTRPSVLTKDNFTKKTKKCC